MISESTNISPLKTQKKQKKNFLKEKQTCTKYIPSRTIGKVLKECS